jgi:anti-sigma B factor antagonist
MPITFTTPDPHTATVTTSIAGALDLAAVPDLHGQVDALLAEDGVTGIVLDLSEVTFLDSSGIGALVGCLRKANEAGKTLRVDNAHGLVREVLDLTNVTPLLTGQTPPGAGR